MWQLLKDIVSGAAAFFRFAEKKQDFNNSPEMKANAEAKTEQEVKNDARSAIASGDLERIRKMAAE